MTDAEASTSAPASAYSEAQATAHAKQSKPVVVLVIGESLASIPVVVCLYSSCNRGAAALGSTCLEQQAYRRAVCTYCTVTSLLRAGMAGSGKTTLMQRISSHLNEHSTANYLINLDPAVLDTPYEANIDIRDTVRCLRLQQHARTELPGASALFLA